MDHNNLLNSLDIHATLKARIVQTSFQQNKDHNSPAIESQTKSQKFVLYLPTVNLRFEQNPAFALACHLANHYELPCLVLPVVLDDTSLPPHSKSDKSSKEVVMTSRRLAFILEALSEVTKQWFDHGAGVAVRVHGPKCRVPDHLTLVRKAMAVVTDEPFVNPFLTHVQRVEKACLSVSIPCFRVDGSTTVPPCSNLKKVNERNTGTYYKGVPAKAWMWQKKTESQRMSHISAAMNGEFDAPELKVQIKDDNFFVSCQDDDISASKDTSKEANSPSPGSSFISNFPSSWQTINNPAPGVRPWTVSELESIASSSSTALKDWAISWPGADSSVAPCSQTIGTRTAGIERWNRWVHEQKGFTYYGKRRTDPLQPHASSRMSCYLNVGIISIFRLVHEVKMAQSANMSGAHKFEEEIVKWREMSYAHAIGREDYNLMTSLPKWAMDDFEKRLSRNVRFGLEALSSGMTDNDKWNAMQEYLVKTGELHNNVRMTWGKQLVDWGVGMTSLCYLNDRFALDGLSPPSYAGLLWCLGWSDKPRNGEIRKKRAYKLPAEALREAQTKLYSCGEGGKKRGHYQGSILDSFIKQHEGEKKIKR